MKSPRIPESIRTMEGRWPCGLIGPMRGNWPGPEPCAHGENPLLPPWAALHSELLLLPLPVVLLAPIRILADGEAGRIRNVQRRVVRPSDGLIRLLLSAHGFGRCGDVGTIGIPVER